MTMTKTTLMLPQPLLDQSEMVARHLNISPNRLFEMALEQFIKTGPDQAALDARHEKALTQPHPPDEAAHEPVPAAAPASLVKGKRPIINQGDVFWIRPENPGETELGFYPHPYVVIQDDLLNHSRIHSVVVCALTSNVKEANAPGNVLLAVGEANLPQQSVVVVSKVSAVNKSQLGHYIGSVNEQRIKQIWAGMRFLQRAFFT